MMKLFGEYHQTKADLETRVRDLLEADVDGAGIEDPSRVLGVLDLTSLEGSDTIGKIRDLCRHAIFSLVDPRFPDAAAVCVYPSLVRVARKELEGTGIKVASVAGAFPSGQSSLFVKLEEVRYALGEGADEIDTVISRGKLLEGFENEVFDELSAIREMCSGSRLKVILETGELPMVEQVRRAAELAIRAGADFIKTSTGKVPAGADPASFLVMLDTVLEYLEKTGKSVGIKPAGGIRTVRQAGIYIKLLEKVLGRQYFDKDLFRIGASSLANEILAVAGR